MANRKGLHPAIACVLMVVMIAAALLVGANKAWVEKRDEVNRSLTAAEATIRLRVETAYNLLTVARRYLSEGDRFFAAIEQDLRIMENTAGELGIRADACTQFQMDAQALLTALKRNVDVQADSRDSMYVTLMLPQAVEQCANNAALLAYDNMANTYNAGLHSFSGFLAQLTDVRLFETFMRTAASQTVQ